MKIIVRTIVVLFVIGILIGAGFWLRGGASGTVEPSLVRLETVGRGDLIEVVQVPAEVQPRTKVSISAKVASRVMELPLKEGEKVTAGTVLVKLDSSDLAAALRSTEARYAAQKAGIQVEASRIEAQKSTLTGSKASLIDAERDFERQKGLLGSHDVSQSVVDTAERHLQEQRATFESAQHSLRAQETNLTVLKHNLEAADAEIVRAQDNLSYTTIVSPIDGILTILNAKVGELVVTGTMNNPGTVIMEVADLSKMIAQARVDETDVANVEVGQSVKIHLLAFPDEIFTGTVTTVALARSTERTAGGGAANADSKTFKVEIVLDTKDKRIPSGLTADVEIQTRKNENVVKVPTQAVLGRAMDGLPVDIRNSEYVDSNKTVALVVFRYVDGKALMTPVLVGASDNNNTMIKAGLKDGDKIITGPYKILELLTHEQAVKEETAASSTTRPATAPAGGS